MTVFNAYASLIVIARTKMTRNFFGISPFVFHERKSVVWVWFNINVSK